MPLTGMQQSPAMHGCMLHAYRALHKVRNICGHVRANLARSMSTRGAGSRRPTRPLTCNAGPKEPSNQLATLPTRHRHRRNAWWLCWAGGLTQHVSLLHSSQDLHVGPGRPVHECCLGSCPQLCAAHGRQQQRVCQPPSLYGMLNLLRDG